MKLYKKPTINVRIRIRRTTGRIDSQRAKNNKIKTTTSTVFKAAAAEALKTTKVVDDIIIHYENNMKSRSRRDVKWMNEQEYLQKFHISGSLKVLSDSFNALAQSKYS